MPRAGCIDWKGRRDELAALVGEGAGVVAIAEQFGCSQTAAHQAVLRAGLMLDPAALHARRVERMLAARASPARREAILRNHADPDWVAHRVAAIRAAAARPEAFEIRSAAARKSWSDQRRAAAAEKMRGQRATPEMRAACQRGAAMRETKRRAWCPADRLADYKMLRAAVGKAEARAIIERDIARAAAKATAAARAKAVPRVFADLLAAAQRGEVRLAERLVLPPTEHAFSLTGGSL